MLPHQLSERTRTGNPQLAARVHQMMAATPVSGILGALGAMRDRPDSFPLLPTLAGLPALVLVGDNDEVTPVVRAQALAEALPDAALSVVAGAAHLTPLEAPGVTTTLLSRFLSTLPTLD
jgi:pimeloyl-ACP methyl ester carboxylesterase